MKTESGSRYRTILLFGMPGSGKGTQGTVLGMLPDLVHVSSGELFRKLPKWSPLGKEITQYTSRGQLVPDELSVMIWKNYIQALELQYLVLPDQHTLILDGMPRNYNQAQILHGMIDVIQIFHLNINDTQKAGERLKARALRENRLDDMNEKVIQERLRVYYHETYDALRFYDPSLVYEVDASQSPLDVLKSIVNRLSELQNVRRRSRPSAIAETPTDGDEEFDAPGMTAGGLPRGA